MKAQAWTFSSETLSGTKHFHLQNCCSLDAFYISHHSVKIREAVACESPRSSALFEIFQHFFPHIAMLNVN